MSEHTSTAADPALEIIDLETARAAVANLRDMMKADHEKDREQLQGFSAGKRLQLFRHLSNAYAIARELMKPEMQDAFVQLYREHFGRDPDLRDGKNPWAPRVALLFGNWRTNKKGERAFVKDASAYKYAASFRYFADSNWSPAEAMARLSIGGNKRVTLVGSERQDRAKYSDGDPDEIERELLLELFIRYMPTYGLVPNHLIPHTLPHGGPPGGTLFACWGYYWKHEIRLMSVLPTRTEAVAKLAMDEAVRRKDEVLAAKARNEAEFERTCETEAHYAGKAEVAARVADSLGLPELSDARRNWRPFKDVSKHQAARNAERSAIGSAALAAIRSSHAAADATGDDPNAAAMEADLPALPDEKQMEQTPPLPARPKRKRAAKPRSRNRLTGKGKKLADLVEPAASAEEMA